MGTEVELDLSRFGELARLRDESNPKSWAVKQHVAGADPDEVERRLRRRKSGVVTVVSGSGCVSADERRRIGADAPGRGDLHVRPARSG